jgi:hypothetical protein
MDKKIGFAPEHEPNQVSPWPGKETPPFCSPDRAAEMTALAARQCEVAK